MFWWFGRSTNPMACGAFVHARRGDRPESGKMRLIPASRTTSDVLCLFRSISDKRQCLQTVETKPGGLTHSPFRGTALPAGHSLDHDAAMTPRLSRSYYERSFPVSQRQTQSQSSQGQSQNQSQGQSQSQGASLSTPAKPDPTSPYDGPTPAAMPERRPDHVSGSDGPEAMEQPYFSEAQSTLSAYAPVERPGDHTSQPEDPLPASLATRPTEQANSAPVPTSAPGFETAEGTVRSGMIVVDNAGQTIGIVSRIEGDKMRLASNDPHDDSDSFLPVSLIDGIDGNRVLLGGRGDASFGMSGE
jgi:hypothetical protein